MPFTDNLSVEDSNFDLLLVWPFCPNESRLSALA